MKSVGFRYRIINVTPLTRAPRVRTAMYPAALILCGAFLRPRFARAGWAGTPRDPPCPDARGLARHQCHGGRIALARPRMGLTLNGIAQGYVTDRVTEILRDNGCDRILANMGCSELRTIGRHADGRPWRIGLADPRRPENVVAALDLCDRALCTSGGYGTKFEPTGRFHHLFDPDTGASADHLHRGLGLRRERDDRRRALDDALRDAAGTRAIAARAFSRRARPRHSAGRQRTAPPRLNGDAAPGSASTRRARIVSPQR
jgi:hypothetical protein